METLSPSPSAAPAGVSIRPAEARDIAAIREIYAHHVDHGSASFEERPPDLAEMERRHADVTGRGLPYLVAEVDGAVAGYAYAAPFRARSAYRYTLENSIYLAPQFQRRGIGAALLAEIIPRCEALGYRKMIAVIGDSANAGSVRLHRRMGFEMVGTLTGVGIKFGRWIDTVYMQRNLGEGSRTVPE